MQTVIIVIHLMVVVALVGVVLLQRSEGGALGIGGGGGGFMSVRGAANALTRTTAILAAAFFATSISLGVLARIESKPTDILKQIPVQGQTQGGGVFDQLAPGQAPQQGQQQQGQQQQQGNQEEPKGPQVPSGQ